MWIECTSNYIKGLAIFGFWIFSKSSLNCGLSAYPIYPTTVSPYLLQVVSFLDGDRQHDYNIFMGHFLAKPHSFPRKYLRWQKYSLLKRNIYIQLLEIIRRAKLLANEMHKSRNFQSLKSDVLLSSPSAYQSITPFLTSKHWKFNYISFNQGISLCLVFCFHAFNLFSWKRSNAVVSRFNRRRSLLIEVQP